LPQHYRQQNNVVQNWRQRNLAPPPRGYQWVCDARRNCFLVRTTTGVIRRAEWYDDRDYRWRQRYARRYTYTDDLYYRECRNRPDPAGILIGGIIGGLLGHAIDRDEPGAVFAGIIIGSVAGAALTRDLDCDDRGYAYRTYYSAFNGGRPGYPYYWNNPHNRHRGEFRVRSYYNDPYGFRCANYTHTAWIPGRRSASGRACRQPDGAWVFVN
jgi:surface antigen